MKRGLALSISALLATSAFAQQNDPAKKGDGFKINVDGNGIYLDGGHSGKSGFTVKNNIITTLNEQDDQVWIRADGR